MKEKLNLCCGREIRPDFHNVDLLDGVDEQVDLSSYPYPWPDNYFSEVFCKHGLEHLDGEKTLQELYRVCKPGARLTFIVPFSVSGFCHIQHKTFFDWSTFKNLKSGFMNFNFKLIHQEPYTGQKVGIGKYRRFIPKKLAMMLSYLNPYVVQHIKAEIECVK